MQAFDGRKGKKLSHEITSDMRFFGYYIGNETIVYAYQDDISIIFAKTQTTYQY